MCEAPRPGEGPSQPQHGVYLPWSSLESSLHRQELTSGDAELIPVFVVMAPWAGAGRTLSRTEGAEGAFHGSAGQPHGAVQELGEGFGGHYGAQK